MLAYFYHIQVFARFEQALSPHTAPLFVSAVRMLPAGLALILWGLRDNRPQPSGTLAWVWIAAFGLADATCFQASYLQSQSACLVHMPVTMSSQLLQPTLHSIELEC